MKAIRKKVKKLKDEIELIEQEAKRELHQLKLIEKFEDFKTKFSKNLTELEFEERKKLVRLLVEDVIVDIKKEEILVRHIIPTEKRLLLCTGSSFASFGKSHIRRFRTGTAKAIPKT